jgi:hypothetical protein
MFPIVQMHYVLHGKEWVMRSRMRESVWQPQGLTDNLEASFFAFNEGYLGQGDKQTEVFN